MTIWNKAADGNGRKLTAKQGAEMYPLGKVFKTYEK